MNAQAELDRAFAAVAARLGDSVIWQHGGSELAVCALLNSGDEPEALPIGATETVIVSLGDFGGLTPDDLTGDIVTVAGIEYSAYRAQSFPDNTTKFWLKRRA